jgi:hypothetical protein
VVFALVEAPAIAERRLLLPVKMNLQRETAGRAFRIHENRLEWEEEPVPLRPDELRRLNSNGLVTAERLRRVVEQLRALLKDGPRPAREIHELRRIRCFADVAVCGEGGAGAWTTFDGQARQWRWGLLRSRVRVRGQGSG